MLSYRHSFHAGNHADVLKHIVQALIIDSLKGKEKPFLYLDTHAGAGRYRLGNEHAERTGEYLSGVVQIWQRRDDFTRQGSLVGDHDLRSRTTNHGLIHRRARMHLARSDGFERLPGQVARIRGMGVEKNDFHKGPHR